MKQVSLKQKIGLILFGLFISLVFLEVSLRIGGFILLSIQEHRNALSLKQKGTYRILCLGETATELGDENSYSSQLQNILNEQNIGVHFVVINRGIRGIDTTTVLSQSEGYLSKYQPDMVVVMMGIYDEDKNIFRRIKSLSFLKTLRIFNLTRYFCSNIKLKIQEESCKLKKYVEISSSKNLSQPEKISLIITEGMLKKSIELNPRNENAYIGLAWFYEDQGKFVLADVLFKKAVEINPENCLAYLAWGKTYECHDNRYNVENSFNKLIELIPGSEWVYIKFGKFLRFQGKFIPAERAFEKAIELNPQSDIAYRQLARLYQDQNKFILSEKAFIKAIELNPWKAKTYEDVALLYLNAGKYRIAKEFQKRAQKIIIGDYNFVARLNYLSLKKKLDRRMIKLVCVQYPMRSVEPLKNIFQKQNNVILVDNEEIFKDALKKSSYKEYFTDITGREHTDCTRKGNTLLASNIARAILKEQFNK